MANQPDRAPGQKNENPDVSHLDKVTLIVRIASFLAATANVIISLVRD